MHTIDISMTLSHGSMQHCRFTIGAKACTLTSVVRIHELLFLSILKSSGSRTVVRLSARGESVLYHLIHNEKSAGSRPALFSRLNVPFSCHALPNVVS